MRPWIDALRPTVLPKSPRGDAIGYAVRQWVPLTRDLHDGRIEIDNNRVRVVAVRRKNWMFAGSDAGAFRAATIYSLVCTRSLIGVEPWSCSASQKGMTRRGSRSAFG
jgi:transposase